MFFSKSRDIKSFVETCQELKPKLDGLESTLGEINTRLGALESIDPSESNRKQAMISADGKKAAGLIIDVSLDQDVDSALGTYLEFKSKPYKYREAWADRAFYHALQVAERFKEADAFYKETDSLKKQENPSSAEFAWWLHNEYKTAREARDEESVRIRRLDQ